MTAVTIGDTTLPARVADSTLQQARGHMFRREPPEWALVFPGADRSHWAIHMLFVPFALDVLFVSDGAVKSAAELAPWTGHASATAESVIEVPAGRIDADAGTAVRVLQAKSRMVEGKEGNRD